MVVCISHVFEGEPSVANVVEILEPLEVGDGHAARVYVQVGNDEDVLFFQDLVCFGRSRTVRTLGNNLCEQKRHQDVSSSLNISNSKIKKVTLA